MRRFIKARTQEPFGRLVDWLVWVTRDPEALQLYPGALLINVPGASRSRRSLVHDSHVI